MWPYKLVGAVTSHISNTHKYPNLSIEANTPVESIASTDPQEAKHPFLLSTARGDIKATHVIHCTNAFAAHLLPGLKGKIYPIRGQMTRQTAPPGFPRLGDRRSWILHYDFGYDYVTQAPSSSSSSTDDIYLGGGFLKALVTGQVSVEDADVGSARDDLQNPAALATLQDAVEKRLKHGNGTKIVDQWTGVMGFTIDNNPVVGKVPYEISHRRPADAQTEGREWIAAGFCGNGMVNCWLSGKGIAEMLLKGEEAVRGWFPVDEYACTTERLEKMTLVERFLEFVKDAV